MPKYGDKIAMFPCFSELLKARFQTNGQSNPCEDLQEGIYCFLNSKARIFLEKLMRVHTQLQMSNRQFSLARSLKREV